MSNDDFDLPATLLDRAVVGLGAADPDARRTLVDALVAEHPQHATGLYALFEALNGADRALANTFRAPTEQLPRLDGYRVEQLLGEGAFGIVYRCHQLEPVQREVAVKILRPGAGDRSTLARFDAERQFLARLNHPAIAQIFDAGLLADGRPWFVMEHVAGVPITTYCDRGRLSIEARLQLFVRLCHGVQHAHEHEIVHRDLKPQNVLVVEADGEPQPKIIDFGIARALQPTAERSVAATETGRVVGTPGYMSPEQSAGRSGDVDARTDVFSLGVMIYELLTGELPWGRHPTTTDSEPPRPSQRIGSDPQQHTTIAEQRQSQPRKLMSRLRGDLDWIVLKALSRERERRYTTAAQLAADIVRHLHGEPVQAGPPTWRYRLRKFVRRRRAGVMATAGLAAAGLVAMLLIDSYRNESHARAREADAAVKSLLERANDAAVTSAPESERVRGALAQEATQLYERFLQQRPDDPALREGHARSLATLAQVQLLVGRFPAAEQFARAAIADAEPLVAAEPKALGPRDALGVASWFLGRALQAMGRSTEARKQLERAIELLDRCCTEDPAANARHLVGASRELVAMLDPKSETQRAVSLMARAREVQQAVVQQHPDSTTDREELVQIDVVRSLVYARADDLVAAKAALQPCEELLANRTTLAPSTTARIHAVAAELLARDGEDEQALVRLAQAVAVAQTWVDREPDREQPLTLLAKLLAQLASWQGAGGSAAARLTSGRAAVAAEAARLARTPDDPSATTSLIDSLDDLVKVLLGEQDAAAWEEAERCAQRAVALTGTLHETAEPEPQLRCRWRALGELGVVADELGRSDADATWQQAEQALQAWHDGHDVDANCATDFLDFATRIARRHLAAGRDERASDWLAHAVKVVDAHGAKVHDLAHGAAETFRWSAVLAAKRGQRDAAIAFAERAHAIDDAWPGWLAASRGIDAACHAADGTCPAACLERAIDLHERAIAALSAATKAQPSAAALLGPLAQTRIRLLLARHQHGDAVDTGELQQAIDTLSALREDPRGFEWDEPLLKAGKLLLKP